MPPTSPVRGQRLESPPAPPRRSVPDGPAAGPGAVGTAWRVAVVCAAVLLVAGVVWLVVELLTSVAVLTVALAVALLLAALLTPLVRWLCHQRTPAGVAAFVGVLVVVGVPGVAGIYAWARARSQTGALSFTVSGALESIERWLVNGPLSLPPDVVESFSQSVRGALDRFVAGVGGPGVGPGGTGGGAFGAAAGIASTALDLLTGAILALFALFFLLKDGARIWAWVVARFPGRSGRVLDDVGRHVWETLTHYGVSVVLVALIDAALIGAGLFLLGVPLAVALTLLIFVGAFVPFVGAIVTGALAVLVTLASLGIAKAMIVLGIVLVVQQLEGNVLQPFIAGRAVALHPLVIIVTVTFGLLVFGIPGGIVAVPIVAASYVAAQRLAAARREPRRDASETGQHRVE